MVFTRWNKFHSSVYKLSSGRCGAICGSGDVLIKLG